MELSELDNSIDTLDAQDYADFNFSLDDILAEFTASELGVPPSDAPEARSRRIVMEAVGETWGANISSPASDDTAGLPPQPDYYAEQPYYAPGSAEQPYYAPGNAEQPYYAPNNAEPQYYSPDSAEHPYYAQGSAEPAYYSEPSAEPVYYTPGAAPEYYAPEREYYAPEYAPPEYYTPDYGAEAQPGGDLYDPLPAWYEPDARPYAPGAEQEAAEEPEAPETEAFPDDDDVKIYGPAPDADRDVKVYNPGRLVEKAERLSHRWGLGKRRPPKKTPPPEYNQPDYNQPADNSTDYTPPEPEQDAAQSNYPDSGVPEFNYDGYAPDFGAGDSFFAPDRGGSSLFDSGFDAEYLNEDGFADNYADDYGKDYAEDGGKDYGGDYEGRSAAFDADAPEIDAEGVSDTDAPPEAEYATEGWTRRERRSNGKRGERRESRGKALAVPILSFLAMVALKLEKIRRAGFAVPEEDELELGEELPAEEASKYYGGHLRSLRLRLLVSIFPAVVLLWLSFGLPAFGALGADLRVRSLVCLILQLSLMLLALDVFTAGMMSLARGKPGIWSLAAFSCIVSALDAAVTAGIGDSGWGLPFCGASGLSMVFALWGADLTSGGLRQSLRVLTLAKEHYTVSAESGVVDKGTVLLRTKRDTDGFLRRCEEPDAVEDLWSQYAPILLGLSFLLSIIACIASGQWTRFFRFLAAISAPMAPLAAFIACPLPVSIISGRLIQSGSAVAGWSGTRDIGSAKHLVVTDADLFPATTLSISSIRVLEQVPPEKAIGVAGSMICASGSSLAPVFLELMRRNGCTMQRVEDFACHEGGGLVALIAGERTAVGSAGFMHLIGVHLPGKLASPDSVYLSVNGELNAIFTINYTPVVSVQEALYRLLRSRRRPIFAVRDFLLTPLVLRRKFRLPTEGFDFPSFARRYEISAAQPGAESQISALISREGLGSLVELSDCGRRAYLAATLGTLLSAACALVGMGLMFWLAASGAMPAGAVGRLLTLMLLWLLPSVLTSLGLLR